MKPNLVNKLKNFINQQGVLEVSKTSGIGVDILIEDCGLDYKTFKDIEFKPTTYHRGVCSETYFRNGYGVSVIKHTGSYGGNDGLYELAVLKDNALCYDTEITSDVIGYLTPDDVTEIMIKVQELKK
jgi:hypothetical protein